MVRSLTRDYARAYGDIARYLLRYRAMDLAWTVLWAAAGGGPAPGSRAHRELRNLLLPGALPPS